MQSVLPEGSVRETYFLGQGKHQAEVMLGDRFGVCLRGTDHEYFLPGGRLHVDVVVTDPVLGDDDQLFGRLQEGTVDFGNSDHHRVGVFYLVG